MGVVKSITAATNDQDRWLVLRRAWPVLYAVFVTGALFAFFSHLAYDDPFITYRYARNLANGLGFVYNPGERVLSTTTPLYALLLALLSFAWPDIHALALLVSALGAALGGLFLWDLAQTWKTPEAGWAGLLLYPGFHLLLSTLGSETPLYLAFCLGAFAFYARRRYTATAALAALAVLTRPDGALVPVLLAAHFLLFHRRPIPWRAIALFAAILLPWALFGLIYFGSPLPVTLAAKQSQGEMAISRRFLTGFFTVAGWYRSPAYLLEAALALLGVAVAFLRKSPWLLFLAWTAFYFTAYSILQVSSYFWYYTPLAAGFLAAAGLGLGAAQRGIQAALAKAGAMNSSRFAALAAGLLLILALWGQARSAVELRRHPDNRYAIYRATGEWLHASTPGGATVGALEVGIIGYYARRPMIDFAGLIQPEVARQMQTGSTYADTAAWAVARYHPDFIVLHRGHVPALESGYLAQSCQRVKSFQGKQYGYTADLDIYDCTQP